MKLSQILSQIKIDYKLPSGFAPDAIEVSSIELDSRLVKKNSVFFALPGKTTNGLEFVDSAIKNGASAVIAEGFIESSNPHQLLVEFLQIFYTPRPTNIYAITGTNGKTSVAEFTRQILEISGKKAASIGTLGVMCDSSIEKDLQSFALTTPDLVSLYKNLQVLKKNGVDDVAIEVSSIGLEQGRIAGLEIEVGAFTNFSQDHLDYHKSMAEYLRCKMILFENTLENGGVAVLNSDIPEFAEIKKICERKKLRVIEYGFKARDLRLCKIEPIENGQKVFFEFEKKNYQFELSVSGEFQAFNALCALGNVLTKNNLDQIPLEKFNILQPAPGRMQCAGTLLNKARVYIDFAHTPDALENVLKLAREITKKRVVVLFGCGGNRDAKKRPIMGKLACELADLVIVSDDNPRTEKAETIRDEILSACDMAKTVELSDRKHAIEKAVQMLEAGDILILAGKGHEKYQIIGATKFEFDEEKIVKNAIAKIT